MTWKCFSLHQLTRRDCFTSKVGQKLSLSIPTTKADTGSRFGEKQNRILSMSV